MTEPANLNARIIEGLYAEGLMLSDEVRATFDLSHQDEVPDEAHSARIALSCEALRTTTRMMHSMAWLINHRAYFRNEISEFQLRRHGRIATNLAPSAPARLALLPPAVQDLIAATERFYARLVRLDSGWRTPREPADAIPAVQRLRDRLLSAVG